MYHAKTTKEKVRLFLAILWPILITQIGTNAMTLLDTIMSGQAGTADLAGVAIGSNLWMPVFIAVNGVLLAVTPIVSQLFGAGLKDRIAAAVMQAVYLSAILSVIVLIIGTLSTEPVLRLMDLDPEVHAVARNYLIGLSYGIFPLFISVVIRNFFDAQGFTRVTMTIIVMALPINIVLNYALIFGKFGFPRMGGAGAGYATAITYWIILLLSLLLCFKLEPMRRYRLFLQWPPPSWLPIKELISIGLPIGLSVFFEASIFSMVTLLMGSMFDTVTIAAHQAASSFGHMMFMIPLSISMTLTILVGYEVGAGRFKDAKQYSLIGVSAAGGIAVSAAMLLYFNRPFVASLYTDAPDVAWLAQQFLVFLTVFQLSDAAQASLQGVLRGYKDVKVPFVMALISYWFIGIPLGYALSWGSAGPFGYWIGITIGLTCAAAGFAWRLRKTSRQGSGAEGTFTAS